MIFKHCLEYILSNNLNLRYEITLVANPDPFEEMPDWRLEDFFEEELNEDEMMPVYRIELLDAPIQIYVCEAVDIFEDHDETGEDDNPYFIQFIYEIEVYNLNWEFIEGGSYISLDDIEALIKKFV